MKTAKELYPECQLDDRFSSPADYNPIIGNLGNVILQIDDNDYQGDSRCLYYRADGAIGYLQFGWGSCSGCDSLQACSSYDDIDQLIIELRDSIRWFSNKEEALHFFNTHDWKGDYSGRSEEQKEFVDKAKALLTAYR